MTFPLYLMVFFISVCRCVVSNEDQSFEELAGWFEKSHMGTSYKRLQELERSDLIDVNHQVRLRDNFNRLRKEVGELKEVLDLQQRISSELDTVIKIFESCVLSNVFEPVVYTENGEKKYVNTGVNLVSKKVFDQKCWEPFYQNYSRLIDQAKNSSAVISRDLPSNAELAQLPVGEKAGRLELNTMRTTYRRLEQLQQESILDVKSNVRIRDNLNRAYKQIIDIKRDTKVAVEKRTEALKTIECIKNSYKGQNGGTYFTDKSFLICTQEYDDFKRAVLSSLKY